MQPGVATKIIAAVSGLIAFVVAILAGLAADNPADTILLRAIIAMIVVQALGFFIGAVAERTIDEAALQYQKSNPIPGQKFRTNLSKSSSPELSTESPEKA